MSKIEKLFVLLKDLRGKMLVGVQRVKLFLGGEGGQNKVVIWASKKSAGSLHYFEKATESLAIIKE